MKKEEKEKGKEKRERKYYEIWGDAFHTISFMRSVIIILAGICVFLVIMLQRADNKPPIVVKVDKLGYAEAITDWQSKSNVTPPEVVDFIKTFVKYYTAYDYYTFNDDIKEAYNMMTKGGQELANQFLQKNNVAEMLKALQPRTRINIAKVRIEKNTTACITAKATAYKEICSYGSDFKKEVIIEAEIILKKVKRTHQHPHGLVVEAYTETVLEER